MASVLSELRQHEVEPQRPFLEHPMVRILNGRFSVVTISKFNFKICCNSSAINSGEFVTPVSICKEVAFGKFLKFS